MQLRSSYSRLFAISTVVAANFHAGRTSLFTPASLNGHHFHLFRDDLTRLLPGLDVYGNKSRKLYSLNQRLSTKEEDRDYSFVASYGGPQSNSMLALALLCAHHKCRFVYYTKPLPSFLRPCMTASGNPSTVAGSSSSNLERALASKMELVELPPNVYEQLAVSPDKSSGGYPSRILQEYEPRYHFDPSRICWVPQGGAFLEAEEGVNVMTREVADFIMSRNEANWKLIIASGTGTVALFAARSMAKMVDVECEVIAVPCVGNAETLQQQMGALDAASGGHGVFPRVLDDSKKRVFAQPYAEHLRVYSLLTQSITTPVGSTVDAFDLVYAPRAWEILLESPLWREGNNLIYYCCGGTEGNASQMRRYERGLRNNVNMKD